LNRCCQNPKRRLFRRDAETSTRDACSTQTNSERLNKVAGVTPVNCASRKVERATRRLRITDPVLILHGVDGISISDRRGVSSRRQGCCPRQRKRLRVN
jgi:hypothetical protein